MNNSNINPKVSLWNKKWKPKTGNLLKATDLFTALKYQETITNGIKGENGIVFMYTNNTAYPEHYNCDGLFYIDIDNVSEYSETIFNNFDKITQRFPNLLAICFSASRNLHLFIYDESFKGDDIDVEEYRMQSKIYLASFAWIVKCVCDIDLRDIDGALDDHASRIGQPMYLAYSEFKWNPYCTQWRMDKNDIKELKAKYHTLFKTFIQIYNKDAMDEVMRVKREENAVFNVEVPRIIDKSTSFDRWSGNDLRRMIASNIMVYCDGDKNEAKKIVAEHFDEPTRSLIISWLNDRYSSFYHKGLYEWLFVSNENKVQLNPGQYLKDVVELGDNKHIYIISNTNTGKTEWCKSMIKNNDNVIALYPNKVLRDGKKHGVEEYTYDNDAKNIDKSKSVNTTIDLFVKSFNVTEVEGKTIIVDEAHLLEDYVSIQGRRDIIKDTINLIQYADRIIFMSATPKSEMRLFNFKVLRFERPQKINLKVHAMLMDMEMVGKGNQISKSNALYNYMNAFVDKLVAKGKKVVVFSDRAQNKWKKYGLQPKIENGECGLYRSKDHTEDCLKQINNFNQLIYPTTLATRYLGVGVEIKKEAEGHIVMCLDEGFDIAFIEQCLGRYRDAKDVYLYLFASKNPEKTINRQEDEQNKQLLMSYYVDLYDKYDMNKMNILKAMKLNAYDGFEEDEELRKAVGMLLANNIVGRYDYASLANVQLMMKRLPYEKVEMKSKVVKLSKKEMEDNYMVFENNEGDMMTYILSLNFNQQQTLFESDIETILNNRIVPYKDRVSARKYMKLIKPIVKRGWELNKWMEFFDGKISTMCAEKDRMVLYCKWKRGDYSLNDENDELLIEKKKELEIIFKEVEMLWSKEFLDHALNTYLDIKVDDIFEMVLNDNGGGDVKDISYYFNFNSYKEYKNAKKKKKDADRCIENGKQYAKQYAKQYKVVTDKLEKKYGLKKDAVFEGQNSIIGYVKDAVLKNIDTTYIDRWRKKCYIVTI